MKLIACQAVLVTIILASQLKTCKGDLDRVIHDETLSPNHDVVAVSTIEHTNHYSMMEMSGWGKGVPDVSDVTGRIYLYSIKNKEITEALSISLPDEWKPEYAEMKLHIWDKGDLYFTLKGCLTFMSHCDKFSHHKLLPNGDVVDVDTLPEISKEYSEVIAKKTAYRTYDDGNVYISVGASGNWKPVLEFKNNILHPLRD